MPTASPSSSGSRNRLRSRPIQSSHRSIAVVPPEGQVDVEGAELLYGFLHSRTPTPVEDVPDPVTTHETGGLQIDKTALEAQRLERASRPWWQRPSATWLIVLGPLSMLAGAALIAPRLQLFTYLMCNDLDHAGPWDSDTSNPDTRPDLLSVVFTRPIPCATDPVVQANVAKLLTITALVQGILSCLTATFWGLFSDRFGRVRFLSLNIVGLLLSDGALAALAIAPDHVPGGYWFLVYISAFEGLIGGRSAAIAAIHAYLADCSNPATRSRIFSRFLGLIFTGVAFGPSLGGLAEHISGNPYVIFYVALGLHVINALFTWFIIPESLLPAQMDAARRARGVGTKSHRFGRVFGFLAPLKVLAPLPRVGSVSPQKTLEKDWSLTWVALSYAPESLLFGGAQYWLQYAAAEFNWTAEIVGYYISLIGLTRALFLAIGLPAVLQLFASRSRPVQLPTSPNEPLNAGSSSQPPASSRDPVHVPAVDLGIARVSLALQAMSFAFMATSKDAGKFVAASALGALASGYYPTVHSLSLELYTRRGGAPSEAGRLFGATSVIQTIGCVPSTQFSTLLDVVT
ncbi:major facilitator superfamily domain-containing protein [Russula dissimulans]|nr:major facilitator superfamily domain-containing protein [Russula dissimulans]